MTDEEPSKPQEPAEAPAAPEPAAAPAAEPQGSAEPADVDALRKDLDEALAREAELRDRLLRLGADFDNFRRRAREDATQAVSRGKEALLRALLPVLDNLDRALAHTPDEGLKLLARQLHATLEQEGIAILAPHGEAFDAKHHEAVAKETREGAEAGTVVEVLEKGYVMDGRVLRPARVVVAG